MFRFFDLESLELRQLLSAAVEPIDGVGNNLSNHDTGAAAGTDLIRLSEAAYTDGIDSPGRFHRNDLSGP